MSKIQVSAALASPYMQPVEKEQKMRDKFIYVSVRCFPEGNATESPSNLEAFIDGSFSPEKIREHFEGVQKELNLYIAAGWKEPG